MKLRLFHQIGDGGADSAAVRQFLVDNGLTEMVEFSNVLYDGVKKDLQALSGGLEAPVLIADGKVVRGRSAIIDWFKTNILCLRD